MVENAIFWKKKWIQPDTATDSCICATCCQYLYKERLSSLTYGCLRETSQYSEFLKGPFCLVCGPLGSSIFPWFIVLYLWWKCEILKKNSARHSCSYLPFDLHNPLLIIFKYEATFLFRWWYIRLLYISMIFDTVFVVGNANCEKNSRPQYCHSYLPFDSVVICTTHC